MRREENGADLPVHRLNALDERVDLVRPSRALPGSPKLATAPGFRAGCNSLHARPRPGRCGSFRRIQACRDARFCTARDLARNTASPAWKSRRLKFHLPRLHAGHRDVDRLATGG